MFGPTSFRRILLSRILLLSVPVLSIGQYVTYRKARSTLLETARQNLTESAVRKGLSLANRIDALKLQVKLASQTTAIESGEPVAVAEFFSDLQPQLADSVRCLELRDLQTQAIVASSCDRPLATEFSAAFRRRPARDARLRVTPDLAEAPALPADRTAPSNRRIEPGFAPPTASNAPSDASPRPREARLYLSAPVYPNNSATARYALTVETRLAADEKPTPAPGSLIGKTVLIDGDGTIWIHPDPARIGRNIRTEADFNRLDSLISHAQSGEADFLHLFSFLDPEVELVAGYASLPSPLTAADASPSDRWTAIAMTPLDRTLSTKLEPIRQVMFNLVLGLLAANLIATLYLAQDLARPVEQLGEYARNVECNTVSEPMPAKFFIYEFNQLSQALNRTIERLKAWAQELENAWKESRNANRLKSEFLTTISHELRTPLNGMIGSLRLIRDGFCDDEEEEREFLQRADDAAVHLLHIINDILDISKIESGTMSVAIETIELMAIVRETIELSAATARDKGLSLVVDPPEGGDVTVRADPAKLKQVLINAVGNAVKFTEAGEVRVTVRVASVPSLELDASDSSSGYGLNEAIVEITDTGIGVDPAHFDRLFKPFVMVDGSRTRRFGGTGLGLAISRNLIEMMNGSIALHSDGIGKGTTVTLRLPVAEQAAASDEAPSPSSTTSSPSAPSPNPHRH